VFVTTIDPVGSGFVASLARPGGNATGFTAFEYSISGKWLELLKEIAPHMTRAAVLRDPALAAGIGQFATIQSMASSSAVELSAIDTRDFGEIERAVVAFARKPNGGLVVTASSSALIHRDQIIALATRLRERNAGCRGVPQDGHLGIEEENGRLRKVVADLTLDKEMLQEVIRRKL
jgi:putative ABC transport system substrate-binding protein